MKHLYLLRHAKSSWPVASLGDRHRPLSARGEENAPSMGARFDARGEKLDSMLSSPATRAHSTAKLFAEACGLGSNRIAVNECLYFTGRQIVEELVSVQTDEVNDLMLVFHNPDITTLANSLDPDFRIDNVPSAGLICFEVGVDAWRDWSAKNTSFKYFDFPKNDSGDVVTS